MMTRHWLPLRYCATYFLKQNATTSYGAPLIVDQKQRPSLITGALNPYLFLLGIEPLSAACGCSINHVFFASRGMLTYGSLHII